MTSVQGCDCFLRKPLSIASSVAPPGSSLPLKSEISEQPNRLLGPKFPAATINLPKYSKNDL